MHSDFLRSKATRFSCIAIVPAELCDDSFEHIEGISNRAIPRTRKCIRSQRFADIVNVT